MYSILHRIKEILYVWWAFFTILPCLTKTNCNVKNSVRLQFFFILYYTELRKFFTFGERFFYDFALFDKNERKRFDKNECKLERFRHITFRKNQCKNENCLRVWQHHHQSIPLYPAVLLLRKCEPSCWKNLYRLIRPKLKNFTYLSCCKSVKIILNIIFQTSFCKRVLKNLI